jgi:UDP-glucose 4-epimerase
MKRKVIVTGGAGFIGSHLVERLLFDGHKVTVIDNFSTGRLENLKHLINNKDLKIVKADISANMANFTKLPNFFKGVDWVFHLAALADIVPSINNPLIYHKANVDGTINVLELARKYKVKRFVYAASSSCYGIPSKFPTSEIAPINPQYPYAMTKYAGESYVMHWGKVYKLPVVSLRFFNVYGTRSRTGGTYGAVIGTFLAQKLAGKPFTVVGNGKQTRDFTYVTDVADALIVAAKSELANEIFNVGSGNTYSINKLVKLLGGEVVYIPKRPGEPDCTFADISKIKKMLGWLPKISFEEGIKTVLKNIDYWKNAPLWTPEKIKKATADWFKYLSD